MNMMEYLEADKNAILQKLSDAGTMEKAEPVIRDEFARLLMKYNETCEEPFKREVASIMMQTARLSSSLINSVGETKIWENVSGKENIKTPISTKQKIFLGTGSLAGVLSVFCGVFSNAGDSLEIMKVLGAILCMVIAVLGGWMAGKGTGVQKKTGNGSTKGITKDYRTENKIDPQHVYTCMHNMIYAADQDLERLALPDFSANQESETGAVGEIQGAQIDIFSDLLEALYCEDGAYALDKIRNIKYYLHQNGIEVVAYDGSNKELFDFMPSMAERTFRPALVCDGKIIKRGLASGGR